jgi:hypothetical protein
MNWCPPVLVQWFAITISYFIHRIQKKRSIWFPSALIKASHLTDIWFVVRRSSAGETENALF